MTVWNWIFLPLFLLLVSFAYAAWRGAPWVPTWKRDIERLIRLIDLKKGETFYELGCGDGRVSALVAASTGANVIGVELSALQWFAAWIRSLRHPNMRVRFADARHATLSDADVVYLFLMPETYEALRPKFESELKKGARVVTYVWQIPGWTPTAIDQLPGASNLYLYIR